MVRTASSQSSSATAGGVSVQHYQECSDQLSSPRQHGCFPGIVPASCQYMVFPRSSEGISKAHSAAAYRQPSSPRQRGCFLRVVWQHERARGLPRISGGVSRSVTEMSTTMFFLRATFPTPSEGVSSATALRTCMVMSSPALSGRLKWHRSASY